MLDALEHWDVRQTVGSAAAETMLGNMRWPGWHHTRASFATKTWKKRELGASRPLKPARATTDLMRLQCRGSAWKRAREVRAANNLMVAK